MAVTSFIVMMIMTTTVILYDGDDDVDGDSRSDFEAMAVVKKQTQKVIDF